MKKLIAMPFEVIINKNKKFPVVVLKDLLTATTAEIYTFGAMLNAFTVHEINIIDGYTSVDDAVANITNGFKSAKLSPFVCRMKNGKYFFQHKNFAIEKFYLGSDAIHGIIFDNIYSIAHHTANEQFASITLESNYAGTDKGFPFPYHISITWQLQAQHMLSVTTAITPQLAMPLADGWHPYFKTDAPIDECSVSFTSNAMVEFDKNLIPTGNITEEKRFEKKTSLKNLQLDNCFVLNAKENECILYGRKINLHIYPGKNYPYLQLYIPQHRQSIAIENLSSLPDSFNNKTGLLLALPGKEYIFQTTYRAEIL